MFDRVDAALGSFLLSGLPDGATVSFHRDLDEVGPGAGPVVRVVLHSIQEDLSGRTQGMQSIRDLNGMVTGRRASARRYALSYAVTAEAATVQAEHALLGLVTYLLSVHDVLPPEHADERLTEAGDLNLMLGPSIQHHAGAGLPRFSVNLVLVAPMAAPLQTDLPKAPEKVGLATARHEPAAAAQQSGSGAADG